MRSITYPDERVEYISSFSSRISAPSVRNSGWYGMAELLMGQSLTMSSSALKEEKTAHCILYGILVDVMILISRSISSLYVVTRSDMEVVAVEGVILSTKYESLKLEFIRCTGGAMVDVGGRRRLFLLPEPTCCVGTM